MTSIPSIGLGLALLGGLATTDIGHTGRMPELGTTEMDADSLLPVRELARGQYGGPATRVESVMTSRRELEAVWPSAPSFELDFGQEMMVLVALGERRTGGYSLEIKTVRSSEDRLVVEYIERHPDPRCPTPQVLTTPYHAVAVPRSEARPRFERTVDRIGC